MSLTPILFIPIITAISACIAEHAEAVTELDQAIGDGDHVYNLQRGLQALQAESELISTLSWSDAWQKVGMLLMSNVGGASGALYATLFIALAKHSRQAPLDLTGFADSFALAIDAVKQRGKADVGEKTMLDVLIPVANTLKTDVLAAKDLASILTDIVQVAEQGVEATRDMLATKGRASFLGERSRGHIDAGAKTAQLMIVEIVNVLKKSI